jgi:hypothetical protein
MQYYGEPDYYSNVLLYLNLSFTVLFTLETALKMVVYNPLVHLVFY